MAGFLELSACPRPVPCSCQARWHVLTGYCIEQYMGSLMEVVTSMSGYFDMLQIVFLDHVSEGKLWTLCKAEKPLETILSPY